MCGIFCCISKSEQTHSCIEDSDLVKLLENRGPNAREIKQYDKITFGGFVLWHQGIEMITQPVESATHVLLFNGDMYNNFNELSDTKWIFNQLSAAENENMLINCFKDIEGPYSIIFYDKLTKSIYFGRDSLGRNSLLIENNNEHFRILSTSYKNDIENNTMELPPLGIYKISNNDLQDCYLFPWRLLDDDSNRQLEQLDKCNMRFKVLHHIEQLWSTYDLNNTTTKYNYNFYNLMSTNFSSTSELYEHLLKDNIILKAITEFSELLQESVKRRVQYTTKFCTACLANKCPCNHSKIAILFSGGIDCSILAVLCDRYISKSDSIDLINVAFENSSTTANGWNVPDRISAHDSYENLQKICPERKWNLIEVNVSKEELHEQLTTHIKHLIFPLNTVLDESIGCAFWFASRSLGVKDEQNWKSSARVVILGSGADELFGGYVRHRNAYNRCKGTEAVKQQNLLIELEKDWRRIPSRNLARDDRIISDNGKTPRAPFIEEHVVRFIRSLLPCQRCCFLLDDGIGDKLFLRLYGYHLGLKSSAFLKKRAIQFGSRIANKKQNAADRSAYL